MLAAYLYMPSQYFLIDLFFYRFLIFIDILSYRFCLVKFGNIFDYINEILSIHMLLC